MMKSLLKNCAKSLIVVAVLINVVGCNHSPVRNPFAGRPEPKLGELPALSVKQPSTKASVAWSKNALSKQEPFSKLLPMVNAKTIFAADHTGKVIALDRKTGASLWSSSTGEKFTAGPSLMNNATLLLATKDAKVIALDANSGHTLWSAKVSSEVLAPPASASGVVLVHAIDGTVSALNGKNGEELWHVVQSTPSLTLRYTSAPVIAGNNVLVGFSTGKLLALNLQSGLIEWERTISIPRGRSELQRMVDISADPIVADNTAYVITYQGNLAAVNTVSGDLLWEREISSYQNMAIDKQHLYVTDNSHHLWAIDRETGATIWKQITLAERYITGPAVMKDVIAVGDRGGYVHFVSAHNGHLLNRFEFSGKLYQNPIVRGNEIIVNNSKGNIAAITLLPKRSS